MPGALMLAEEDEAQRVANRQQPITVLERRREVRGYDSMMVCFIYKKHRFRQTTPCGCMIGLYTIIGTKTVDTIQSKSYR